ncbi:28S ribosomal protein S31 mitochondrial [Fasciola hepatica]|uniref:Small ribosomal subunit protein mS31 n=1 Tax=Fasciola hepatica TaxID=6192 RepID=A0A4E0R0D2_FASHE|nr:28S ribosomal protein S31 mitochondrial [Fasciola hepatica]
MEHTLLCRLPPPEDLDFLKLQPKEGSSVQNSTETEKSTNPIFDAVENLESSLLMLTPPLNQFEEWMQWTVEGKLWRFPIDNEQDWDTENNVPFHEHMFLDQYTDKALRKSPPVAAFLDLVCAGLAQNPHFTVAEKRAHLQWYAEYFKDKLESIDASVLEELRLVELERKARSTSARSQ